MKELAQFAQQQLSLRLSAGQLDALIRYEQELLDWNERFNLTAIRDPQDVRIKHFLDSFPTFRTPKTAFRGFWDSNNQSVTGKADCPRSRVLNSASI